MNNRNIDNVYDELYKKYFNKFETMRKKVKERRLLEVIGCICIYIALCSLDTSSNHKISRFNLMISIFFGIVGLLMLLPSFISKKEINYENLYKTEVIAEFMKQLFPKFNYMPYIEKDFANSILKLYRKSEFDKIEFNNSYLDDYMYMNCDDYDLYICDMHTNYEYVNKNGERHNTDRFIGLFANIKLKYNKECIMKILNKEENRYDKRNIINLDNEQFNNNFLIVCDNDIMAYQILTLDIIQLLNEQMEQYNVKFDISIINNNINFRFYTNPIFEPTILQQVMKKEHFYRYYSVLNFVIKFSEIINNVYKKSSI